MNDDKAIMFAVHLIASKGDCYSATLNMGMTTHSCTDCPWNRETYVNLNYTYASKFRCDRALTYLVNKVGKQATKELLTEVLI